jgi:hypothetical protein
VYADRSRLQDLLSNVLGNVLVPANLGVTGYTKQSGFDDVDVREQQIDVRADEVFEQHVPRLVTDLNESGLVSRDFSREKVRSASGEPRLRTASERLWFEMNGNG